MAYKRKLERDPHIWPRAGDKLKDKHGQVIIVPILAPGETIDLRVWRRVMKNAEVIYRET